VRIPEHREAENDVAAHERGRIKYERREQGRDNTNTKNHSTDTQIYRGSPKQMATSSLPFLLFTDTRLQYFQVTRINKSYLIQLLSEQDDRGTTALFRRQHPSAPDGYRFGLQYYLIRPKGHRRELKYSALRKQRSTNARAPFDDRPDAPLDDSSNARVPFDERLGQRSPSARAPFGERPGAPLDDSSNARVPFDERPDRCSGRRFVERKGSVRRTTRTSFDER